MSQPYVTCLHLYSTLLVHTTDGTGTVTKAKYPILVLYIRYIYYFKCTRLRGKQVPTRSQPRCRIIFVFAVLRGLLKDHIQGEEGLGVVVGHPEMHVAPPDAP